MIMDPLFLPKQLDCALKNGSNGYTENCLQCLLLKCKIRGRGMGENFSIFILYASKLFLKIQQII